MKILQLRVNNFRTLQDVVLALPPTYAAICGPNDSGKTNVVRAIRAFLRERDTASVFRIDDEPGISLKNDFPKFLSVELPAREITVEMTISIHKERDAGLYASVQKQLELDGAADELTLIVKSRYASPTAEPDVTVVLDQKLYTGIPAQEVLEKIRSSRCMLFYNSTQPESRSIYRQSYGGHIQASSPDQETLVQQMKETVNKGLNKLSKVHQQELEALLGRLQTKYKVGVSLPTFDFSVVPYRLTLGQKDFSVPLDDWGSGTVNRTLILLTLFKAKQVSMSDATARKVTPVIVLEEPESFLHPAAQAEFGRVLQDLAAEFDIQVLVTTHSPYLLNLRDPGANVLLKRRIHYNQLLETQHVPTAGENWMEPFSQILGLQTDEFRPWRELMFSRTSSILLVEGALDKEYFELLRSEDHGANRLSFEGEIVPYDGTGNLQNTVLLRFIRNRHSKIFVTFDLDAEKAVEKHLIGLGFERNKSYAAVGIPASGKRCIEGLLPTGVTGKVNSDHPELLQQVMFGTKEEQDNAKRTLKAFYLEEFKRVATPGPEYFGGFYSLIRVINKALAS